MAGVSDKSRFGKCFLEALAFAFQQFGLAFPPRSEQLEVVYAVVTGRRSSDRIWQISVYMCEIHVHVCVKWRLFRIPV